MALKPALVQQIQHGKLLSRAAFPFLVDTWNWMSSALSNFRGDGDNNGTGAIKVDWTRSDHPVIRFDATRFIGSWAYGNFYFNAAYKRVMDGAIVIGRTPIKVEGMNIEEDYTGFVTLKVKLTSGDPEIEWVEDEPFAPPSGDNLEISFLPVYEFERGAVKNDYRGCFNVPAYE